MQQKYIELLDRLDAFFKEADVPAEEDNEELDAVYDMSLKNGKAIEGLEKDVATLKKDSHPSQEFICCRRCGCKIDKTKKKNK